MNMEDIATWPDKILLKNFKKASIRNGDRFTVFVEVEKRGLAEKFKIKENTVLFKMINRTPNNVLFWIFMAISTVIVFLIPDTNRYYGDFLGTAFLILALYFSGVQSHKFFITPTNIVLKKTFFF